MSKHLRYIVLIFGCLLIVSCANTLHMTYVCDPAGATLYEAGTDKNFGTCPTTVNYAISKEAKQKGFIDLNGINTIWVSGATVSLPTIHVNLEVGNNQRFLFNRPRNIPNYDIDANYSLNLQRNAIMATQAQEAIQANELKRYELQKQQIQPLPAR